MSDAARPSIHTGWQHISALHFILYECSMQRMSHDTIIPDIQYTALGPDTRLLRWSLLIYRLPAEPASARTTVWRETKRLGALSLQHAVCLLPESEASRLALGRLAARIEEYGGEATILDTSSPDAAWQDKTVQRFNAARDEEFEEVVDEAERFREEVARERRKGKFTFAELEDEESNLERLRKYLAQVRARDTFDAPGAARAVAEVERCASALEAFAQEIYDRQSGAGDSTP
jgi:hypothetical protein